MRTFLNHIKNETLDEIETSLENLWQQMIQLSEFFQYSFVLILKRKCLFRACRVRSAESGTPSTIIYTRWSSRRYELGCDTPVPSTYPEYGLPWNLWFPSDTLPIHIQTRILLHTLRIKLCTLNCVVKLGDIVLMTDDQGKWSHASRGQFCEIN